MNQIYLLLLVLSPVIVSLSILPSNPVKLEVSVFHKKMILKCSVQNRDSKLGIFLECPFGSTCKENCKPNCLRSDEKCLSDTMIECNDKGFVKDTNSYVIEYTIDITHHMNNGKWKCTHGIWSSLPFTVIATSSSIYNSNNTIKSTKSKIYKSSIKSITKPSLPSFKGNRLETRLYSSLLTKSEFILSVIGLLAVSLIFNIFFCSRVVFFKCKLQKTTYGNGDYFSMQQNQRPFNRCNSQVSDPERIYEDTSMTQRQMSFMTKIKNSNGNYVGQSTLTPSSGPPTLLPPNFLPLNHSMSFPNSQNDSGNHLINTPTQIYYPLPMDSTQANYGAIGFNPDNQYTNFLSVQPELNSRDANNQPLYLAFTPVHPFISANSRYLQYSHQLSNMTAESSTSSNTKPSPVPSQLKNGLVSRSNSEQDNYQLSREMMEEADNLLRTADTLLKSTQQEMNKIHS